MRRVDAIQVLSEYAADQWGLVTAAQAKKAGVGAVTLLRLVEAGLLDHVHHGVYLAAGAVPPEHLDIKAAWLRLDAKTPGWERYRRGAYGGVVSHTSACLLHDLGDIPSTEVEMSVPRRRTTRDDSVRLRVRSVDDADVTIVEGLPTTTAPRTITDLLAARADGGHIGGVIADADRHGMLDLDVLAERVAPFTRTYGLPREANGAELIEHLVGQAGAVLRTQEIERAEVAGQEQALSLVASMTQRQREELMKPLHDALAEQRRPLDLVAAMTQRQRRRAMDV